MFMLTNPINTSYVRLHANEVYRLANSSINEINANRQRLVNAALDEVKDQVCNHFWGLYKHQLYPDRETALEYAPEVLAAKQFARQDITTCELLIKAANYLMQANIAEDERYINVSLSDFRAIS